MLQIFIRHLSNLSVVNNLPHMIIQVVNIALGIAAFLYIIDFQDTLGYISRLA